MDHYLAEVLCDNLISNALKHSFENKAIGISLDDKTLIGLQLRRGCASRIRKNCLPVFIGKLLM